MGKFSKALPKFEEITKMKKINYILAILFLFTSCDFSNNSMEEKGSSRRFIFKKFQQRVDIILYEDFSFINSTFAHGCMGGYSIKWVWGEYNMENGQVFFTPKRLILEEDWGGEHFHSRDSIKTFDTVDYYFSNSTKIHLIYWHIKNGNFEFLISDTSSNELDGDTPKSSNFIAFANLYNANIVDEICKFVFCNIDTIANVKHFISRKNIPEKFRYLFLDEPIEATIKSVKIINEGWSWHGVRGLIPIYTLVSDRVDDAFIGMKLYLIEHTSERYYYPITIIDKKDDVLIARGVDLSYETDTKKGIPLKIGAILRTESVYSEYVKYR